MKKRLIFGSIVLLLALVFGMWLGANWFSKQPIQSLAKKTHIQVKKKPIAKVAKPAVAAPIVMQKITISCVQQQSVPPAPAALQVQQVPPTPPAVTHTPTPAPTPALVPTPAPQRTVNVLSGNSLSINILSSVGGGWRPGIAVNGYGGGYGYRGYGYGGYGYSWGPRWVPGYERPVCEDRSTGRVCYRTWEPAHYE